MWSCAFVRCDPGSVTSCLQAGDLGRSTRTQHIIILSCLVIFFHSVIELVFIFILSIIYSSFTLILCTLLLFTLCLLRKVKVLVRRRVILHLQLLLQGMNGRSHLNRILVRHQGSTPLIPPHHIHHYHPLLSPHPLPPFLLLVCPLFPLLRFKP